MLEIRRAAQGDFPTVRRFYHSLIDAMQDAEYQPGWIKGVYPPDSLLREGIAGGGLFLAEAGNTIAGAMVADGECNEGYRRACWPSQVKMGEFAVIHALGVHPDFARQGVAKALVAFAIRQARTQGKRALRLDVLAGYLPAERLYLSLGFAYVDTVRLYYADTGWTDFKLFEHAF